MASKKSEELIRSYLSNVGKTDKAVVDKEAVKALKAQVRSEADPIEKLRLLAALEDEQQGRVPDRSAEQEAFVAEAKGWAESEGIPVSAFQSMRVPDDVLRQAGFTVSATRSTGTTGGRSSSRAPRVPMEQVEAAARGLGSPFTLNQLADALDREPATVRNYVNKLIEQGTAKDMGDDPSHDGRGRAPKLYSLR